jgi:hypothetical protein
MLKAVRLSNYLPNARISLFNSSGSMMNPDDLNILLPNFVKYSIIAFD